MLATVQHVALLGLLCVLAAVGAWLGLLVRDCHNAGRQATRWYWAVLWASLRWRSLMCQLGLAKPHKDAKVKSRRPYGPSIGSMVRVEVKKQPKLCCPRARIRPDRFGISARVRTVPGVGRAEFEAHAKHIADAWRCDRVKVTQTKPGRLHLRGFRMEPLSATFDSPLIVRREDGRYAPARSWGEIGPSTDVLVGFSEDGDSITINLARGAHGLIAGTTRSGKSITVNTFLLAASLMRNVELWIIDPNLAAAAPWWRTAKVVTDAMDPAAPNGPTDILKRLRAELDRRKGLFWSQRTDKITKFTKACPLILLVIDEVTNYTQYADKKKREAFTAELLAVASQAAKFGVRLWLLAQKPSADVLPTPVRTNLSDRICHRVDTTEDFLHAFPAGRDLDITAADKSMPQGVSVSQVLGMTAPVRMRSVFTPTEACWDVAEVLADQGRAYREFPTTTVTELHPVDDVA